MSCKVYRLWHLVGCLLIGCLTSVNAQILEADDVKGPVKEGMYVIVSPSDWFYAANYAPVVYQETKRPTPMLILPPPGQAPGRTDGALADLPPIDRADFITRIDYDGNWIATDNWENFDSPHADFRAVVYFSTAETHTHVFLFYTFFHPRDIGSIHENDLEGAVVVVEKGPQRGLDKLVYVQTLAHNVFYKYYNPETVAAKPSLTHSEFLTEGTHPILYIEPRGHGVKRYTPPKSYEAAKTHIIYRYKGRAEEPGIHSIEDVGYDLVPLYSTVWKAALLDSDANPTFTDFRNYGPFTVQAIEESGQEVTLERSLERIGASMIGDNGRPNAAHPPWGWSLDGRWFFLPAEQIIKDANPGEGFSRTYIHHPFLQIYRPQ